ncbi:hypothetical protein WN51_05761 [Melipona quadrifasciata]|uniref:Uncharacterized protein n=1 Tax=Melipona quadrifasciata TaxID=166423 RepID=A0A0M9A5W9_9HYME|nr:hypothetical protein WN51_05761 [Melipona quadrifasciata]
MAGEPTEHVKHVNICADDESKEEFVDNSFKTNFFDTPIIAIKLVFLVVSFLQENPRNCESDVIPTSSKGKESDELLYTVRSLVMVREPVASARVYLSSREFLHFRSYTRNDKPLYYASPETLAFINLFGTVKGNVHRNVLKEMYLIFVCDPRRSIPEQSKPAPSTSPHTHVNQPGNLAASSGGGGGGGAPCVGIMKFQKKGRGSRGSVDTHIGDNSHKLYKFAIVSSGGRSLRSEAKRGFSKNFAKRLKHLPQKASPFTRLSACVKIRSVTVAIEIPKQLTQEYQNRSVPNNATPLANHVTQVNQSKLHFEFLSKQRPILILNRNVDTCKKTEFKLLNDFSGDDSSGATLMQRKLAIEYTRNLNGKRGFDATCFGSVEFILNGKWSNLSGACNNTKKLKLNENNNAEFVKHVPAVSRPRIPQIRVSNTRLAQTASGCAPSVDVLPIFDVKQQSVRNPARMGANQPSRFSYNKRLGFEGLQVNAQRRRAGKSLFARERKYVNREAYRASRKPLAGAQRYLFQIERKGEPQQLFIINSKAYCNIDTITDTIATTATVNLRRSRQSNDNDDDDEDDDEDDVVELRARLSWWQDMRHLCCNLARLNPGGSNNCCQPKNRINDKVLVIHGQSRDPQRGSAKSLHRRIEREEKIEGSFLAAGANHLERVTYRRVGWDNSRFDNSRTAHNELAVRNFGNCEVTTPVALKYKGLPSDFGSIDVINISMEKISPVPTGDAFIRHTISVVQLLIHDPLVTTLLIVGIKTTLIIVNTN